MLKVASVVRISWVMRGVGVVRVARVRRAAGALSERMLGRHGKAPA